MKKEVKRQIKEDKFIDVVNKGLEFIRTHQRELWIGVGAVVVVFLVYMGIRWVGSIGASKQNQVLTRILSLRDELKTDPDKITELEGLAGGGKYSRMAYLESASFWLARGDMERAESRLLQIKSGRKDLVYYQARDLLGQLYARQKKYDQALAVYEDIEDNPRNYARDVILFHMAEVLAAKGETARALDIFRSLQEEFSQTYFGYEASQKVRELEGKK